MRCTTLLYSIAVLAAIGTSIIFFLDTLPENVKFTAFNVSPPKDLVQNNVLNNVERLFQDEIKGPEGFEVLNGDLYTTVHGGHVVKVYEDQLVPVVKFGEPCEVWWEESKCGRPLGIKAFGNEYLIVADAYYGIFKYNVKNKKVNKLVDKDIIINGVNPKIFNAVEVAKDGTIYWTYSSAHFGIENSIYTFLADGSGGLVKYDPKTNQNTVLLKDLFFPNGVILSPNEDFLLISESGQNRILRYYLKGPKKFTSDVFFDGLPGSPDNLRSNGENGLFVPLVLVKNENYPLTLQSINDLPLLRKFLARFMSLTELLLHKIYSIQPNDFVKRAIHTIGHMESILPLLAYNITLIELNWNGDFVKSYQGSDGSFSFLSDVVVHNDYLYLGSPTNTFLGRIKLSKLGDISTFKPKSSTKSIPAAPPATPKPQQQTTVPSPSTTAVPPRTTTKAKSQITSPPPAANPTTTTNNRPKTNSPPPTPAPKPTNQQNRNPNH